MIKTIFLPEQINNYYLFGKRIIGLDIGKNQIALTQLYMHGSTRTIELYLEHKLDLNDGKSSAERIADGLTQLFLNVKQYDEIHSVISSSLVVFKELKLPFVSHEKIASVINFEVEPLLPFALNDAVVDFIITKKNDAQNSADILVAAVQKQEVIDHLNVFGMAGLDPDVVSIDLFDLYGLYQQIPAYQAINGNTALIDVGLASTRIAFIQEGQLRFIRVIPSGMNTVAKSMAETLELNPAETIDELMRFGANNPNIAHQQATREALTRFWQSIKFTLSSFCAQTADPSEQLSIILLGAGARIADSAPLVAESTGYSCQLLDAATIATIPHITIAAGVALTESSMLSISAALPTDATAFFNLRKNELKTIKTGPLTAQLITAILLLMLIVISLFAHLVIQQRQLNNEIIEAQQEVTEKLTERFKSLDPETLENESFQEIVSMAKSALDMEEKTWFAFSSKSRASNLQYLLELTDRIDKDRLGFVLKSLRIMDNVMTIEGQTKGFTELKMLEKELRQSKLFDLPREEDPQSFENFTLKLLLKPNIKGGS